jgi:putative FmdB family regulatory protein
VPIYEYRCDDCGKLSSALLPRFDAPDPACSHCGREALRRQVSTFATVGGEEGYGDDDFDSGPGAGDDDLGGDFGADDDW